MAASLPTYQTMAPAFNSESVAIDLLVEVGVLRRRVGCGHCNTGVCAAVQGKPKVYRCTNRYCRKTHSITQGTFWQSRITANVLVHIAWHWLCGSQHGHIVRVTGVSGATVA